MIFRILFQYSEKEKDTSFIFFVLSAQLQISVSTVLLPKLISAWLIFEVNTITQSKVIKDFCYFSTHFASKSYDMLRN